MHTENKQSNDKKNNIEENIDDILLFQNKKIQDLKVQLLKNKKKIDDLELRKLANIENINKNTKEKINKIKYTETEKCLKKIIPIIDSLEDILTLSKKLNITEQPLIKGIELTLQSLFNILFKLNVKIEGNKNEVFNSNIHDIFEKKTSNDIPYNHIISIHKKGFSLNKVVLRKAIVTISKK
ncbi:nucleotide exchange factor GrpE [Buchnera aphidicola (Brachycaudus cardui)]|uniref:Protein GrpE n=1 Tax=Buchnera aphidicola (Brachycaudus cardui) TaxID=557993 RepID=A0A4D6Y166_9GAMM|nr:nucleotide exchange factor GrpE [Buchnera aphidicola]QCI20334.1 nucleotide exchange factor GrpE [Buchnera aphidicola (Brachycaudus cardui)]